MTPSEFEVILSRMTEAEFDAFKREFGGNYDRKGFVDWFLAHGDQFEGRICHILKVPTEADKLASVAAVGSRAEQEQATAAHRSNELSRSANAIARWSMVVSGLALLATCLVPYLMYRYFHNESRIQQIKQASLRARTKTMGQAHSVADSPAISRTNVIEIVNDGPLPIADVEVIVSHQMNTKFFDGAHVSAHPPIAFKRSVDNGALTASFEKALAPGQTVSVFITREQLGGDLPEDDSHVDA